MDSQIYGGKKRRKMKNKQEVEMVGKKKMVGKQRRTIYTY